MIKQRSALCFCLFAILLTGLLTACGGSPAPESNASTPAPVTAQPTEETAATPVVEATAEPTEESAEPTEEPAAPTEEAMEATEEAVAATEPIEGFNLEETDTLSIQLPEAWDVIEVTPDNLEQVFEELKASNPEIVDAIGSAEALQGAVLWAFNGEPSNPNFVDNLNIRSTPLGGQQITDMQEVLDAVTAQYDQLGLKVTEMSTDLEINGQPAARVDYMFDLNSAGGEATTIEGHQYLALGDDALWILSYSIDPASSSELFPLIEQSAMTFTTK